MGGHARHARCTRWLLSALLIALAGAAVAVVWSAHHGYRDGVPQASQGASVGVVSQVPLDSIPPPPPPLPAFELTVRQARLRPAPFGDDACSQSLRAGLAAFEAAAYSQAESHLRAALEHCGVTPEVLGPLGLTQLWHRRYVGAVSYLQPALARTVGADADELQWYLGIAHHRTGSRVEAYRYWDIVCAGTSQFSTTACQTLEALRAHDAEVAAWKKRR